MVFQTITAPGPSVKKYFFRRLSAPVPFKGPSVTMSLERGVDSRPGPDYPRPMAKKWHEALFAGFAENYDKQALAVAVKT